MNKRNLLKLIYGEKTIMKTEQEMDKDWEMELAKMQKSLEATVETIKQLFEQMVKTTEIKEESVIKAKRAEIYKDEDGRLFELCVERFSKDRPFNINYLTIADLIVFQNKIEKMAQSENLKWPEKEGLLNLLKLMQKRTDGLIRETVAQNK